MLTTASVSGSPSNRNLMPNGVTGSWTVANVDLPFAAGSRLQPSRPRICTGVSDREIVSRQNVVRSPIYSQRQRRGIDNRRIVSNAYGTDASTADVGHALNRSNSLGQLFALFH